MEKKEETKILSQKSKENTIEEKKQYLSKIKVTEKSRKKYIQFFVLFHNDE